MLSIASRAEVVLEKVTKANPRWDFSEMIIWVSARLWVEEERGGEEGEEDER
jgi:hypothetical protein